MSRKCNYNHISHERRKRDNIAEANAPMMVASATTHDIAHNALHKLVSIRLITVFMCYDIAVYTQTKVVHHLNHRRISRLIYSRLILPLA